MQKIIFICLIGLIGIFQYQYRHGIGGLKDVVRIQQQIKTQKETNLTLEDRNNALTMKIAGLKGSTDFLEARARQELNLVKPDETLVLLPGNNTLSNKIKKQ